MDRALNALWYGDGAVAVLLQPLAGLYGVAVGARRSAYAHGWLRSQTVGKPVIVVGNLTVGGTGKTPLVAWLAAQLRAQELKVGIVSRGYGRSGGALSHVQPEADWRTVGDEPLLLSRVTGCPTVVAVDRVAGARALVEQGVDIVLADDGLQHLRLARDCEIVVVDGVRGLGNGRLLPAGPLREPAARLGTADAVVFNGAPDHPSVMIVRPALQSPAVEMTLAPGDARSVSNDATTRQLESFRGQTVHAVAGIGHPPRFFRSLQARGIEIIAHAFADHHPFEPADLEFGDGVPVLMTAKDAVKCRAFANTSLLWYVPVAAQFSAAHAQALLGRVANKLGMTLRTKG